MVLVLVTETAQIDIMMTVTVVTIKIGARIYLQRFFSLLKDVRICVAIRAIVDCFKGRAARFQLNRVKLISARRDKSKGVARGDSSSLCNHVSVY